MDPAELLSLAKAQPDQDQAWVRPCWLRGCRVSETDRRDLVDWLVQVQDYLDLSDVTLHLAVANVDRVLDRIDFDPDEFQLLGLASLLVAAKLEEDQGVTCGLDGLLALVDNVHGRADLARVELELLRGLDWRPRRTTAAVFLHLYQENWEGGKGRKRVFRLARALLDICLTKEWQGTLSPSLLASSCLLASCWLLGPAGPDWSPDLSSLTGYSAGQLTSPLLACLTALLAMAGEGGVREKHARLLDRLGDNIGPEAVGAVIKAVRTAHLRTNRNAICG